MRDKCGKFLVMNTCYKCGQGDEGEDKQEQSARFIIEEPTDEEQVDVAQMEFLIAPAIWNTLHNQRKQRINQCEESPEVKLGEEQRTVLIKG